MDKERLAQLIADYREGKITAEEFSAKRAEMQGLGPLTDRHESNETVPAKTPMSQNAKILLWLGSGIFLMLCVITFLLFWNSPEQVAKRALHQFSKGINQETQESIHETHALRIIADLRYIKIAALMFFVENADKINHSDFFIGNTREIIAKFGKYMDDPESLDKDGDYMIMTLTDNTCLIKKLLSQTPVEVRRLLAFLSG